VAGYDLPGPPRRSYNCDFQGLARGWSDSYDNGYPCQYMDVTSLAPGRYILRVTVNPDRVFPELRYDNNSAELPVELTDLPDRPDGTCAGWLRGPRRECGWSKDSTRTCQPGTPVSVGCGLECGLGSQAGNAMIRVCEGSDVCRGPGLGADDDCAEAQGGARVDFACPPGGVYTVMVASSSNDERFTCAIAVM
jgi:hypothetical protein